MTWGETFVVFFASHQAGDYLVQTDWQATHKHGGLSRDRIARGALASHTFTYSLVYVPAFVWISSWLGWQTRCSWLLPSCYPLLSRTMLAC